MYKNFKEIEEYLVNSGIKKRVVLANAQDDAALAALVHAKKANVVEGTLVGNVEEIINLLKIFGEDTSDYEIIEASDEVEAARKAMELIKDGKADIPMKGIMQTATYMKAILNKENGFFEKGSLLSQATVLEWKEKDKLLIISDCAVNISPDVEAKRKIINNCVKLANGLGIDNPKVAVLSAVEVAKESIPSTMDAKALSEMEWNNCVVGGPFALDNAISVEAAKHKGINHPVAGNADILIVPDLCSGNIFTKALTFFAHMGSSGALCGGNIPAIMTSRTDTPENKYNSILTAIAQSLCQ